MPSPLRQPVNVISDFSIGPAMHGLMLPPPVPPPPKPPPTVSVEMIAPMLWAPGFATNANKFTNTPTKMVTHKGQWIMLDGHDCGMLIPDVTIPPTNIWYPMMWPFSSRKPVFSGSMSKCGGTALAGAGLVALPPTPMMTCAEPISLPSGLSMINALNTVHFGLSLLDLLAGVLTIAASIAIDAVFNAIGNRGAPEPFPGMRRAFANAVAEKCLLGVMPLAKAGVSALVGFGISAIRGNPTFTIGAGLPILGGQISISTNPDPGQPHVVAQGTVLVATGDTTGNSSVLGSPAAPPPSP